LVAQQTRTDQKPNRRMRIRCVLVLHEPSKVDHQAERGVFWNTF
jgi:hypothetical protein